MSGMIEFDIPDEICNSMILQADIARRHSYPEANKVGSVVLTASGRMYRGVSYHADIMSLTMHAEATALAHAAIHGHRNIIAITGPNCHACKQLIWESSVRSGIDVMVIIRDQDQMTRVPISTMMAYGWPPNPWLRQSVVHGEAA